MHWGIRLNGFEYIFFIKAPSLKWLCMCLSYTHLFEAFWVFFSWILCHSVSPLVSGVRYASFAERWNNNKWKGESRVTTVNWLILLRAERGRESEQNLWIGSSAWNHEKTTHTHSIDVGNLSQTYGRMEKTNFSTNFIAFFPVFSPQTGWKIDEFIFEMCDVYDSSDINVLREGESAFNVNGEWKGKSMQSLGKKWSLKRSTLHTKTKKKT